jgi:ABC-type Co2+ transport system permease subunit
MFMVVGLWFIVLKPKTINNKPQTICVLSTLLLFSYLNMSMNLAP